MRIFTLLALLLAGCGAPEANLCDRLDECNALADMSINECTEVWTDALEDMSSAQASDCEAQLQDCLDLSSCDNFMSCDISDC